jgi:hypothetical protein
MTQSQPEIRGFKHVFTTIGVTYTLLASSWLVRGPTVLRDFGVSDRLIADPVFVDFFMFFYEYMAFGGAVQVLLGRVTRGLRAQTLVACVYTAFNVFATFRDISTSDSRFGSRLYHGDATLLFVVTDVVVGTAFGVLAVAGLRRLRAEGSTTAAAQGA